MNTHRHIAPVLCILILIGYGFQPAQTSAAEAPPRARVMDAPSVRPAAPAPGPTLLSPDDGADLDNGRTDRLDSIIWDFDWSDVAGATEYHIHVLRDQAPGPIIDQYGLSESEYHYRDVGGFIGTTWFAYRWKVRAKVGGVWTEWSETRSFHVEPVNTDPPAPPDVPMPLSPPDGAEIDNGRTDGLDDLAWSFDWTDVDGASEYHLIVMRQGTSEPFIDCPGLPNSCYHYADSGGYFGDAERFGWAWQVRAKVRGNWSAWSAPQSFSLEPVHTDPPYPTVFPILLFPPNRAVLDNGRLDGFDDVVWVFDWSEVTGATQYQIVVNQPGVLHPVLAPVVPFGSSYRHVITGAYVAGECRNWTWQVRAMVGDIWGPWSEVRTFDVETVNIDPPYGPASPALIGPRSGAELDNGRTDHRDPVVWNFDWTDVRGATEYFLLVKRQGDVSPLISQGGLVHSSYHYTVTDLPFASHRRFGWTWQVSAKVAGAWGPWSEVRPFFVEPIDTDPANQPGAPHLISPPDTAQIDNGRLDGRDHAVWNFDWADVPGATQYHIIVTMDGATFPLIYHPNLSTSSFQYVHAGTFIPDGQISNWKWNVRAMVAGFWSEWSETRSFDVERADTDPPPQNDVPVLVSPLDGLELDNGRSDRLDDLVWDFDWSDVSGATEYWLRVERQGTLSPAIDRQDLTVSAVRHVAAGSLIDDPDRFNWTWRVRARVDGVWRDWSEARSFSVEPVDTDPRAPSTYLPNLRILSCDSGPCAPLALLPGCPFVLGAFVENNGAGVAGPSWLEFWGSRTGGLTLDVFLGDSALLGPMGPGGVCSYATTKTLYSIPDGPYTVVFAADRPNSIREENERDNRGVVAGKRILVLRPQTQADLSVEGFTLGSNPLSNGQTLRLGGVVRNVGTQDSGPFWIEFWGSYDRPYPNIGFMLCDSIGVPNLAPGASVDLSAYAPSLYACPSGVFQAGVFVDRPDHVNELDETNNYVFLDGIAFNQAAAPPAEPAEAGGPDLVVASADFAPWSPVQVAPGSPISLWVRVENRGTAPSGPFWLEFWGSKLGGLALEGFVTDSEPMLSIPAGGAVDLAVVRKVYSLPDGPYTLTVFADRPGHVTESNEGNNRFCVPRKRLLSIRPPTGANLVIEGFGIGPNPMRLGQTVTFSGRIRNTGTQDSGPFWIEFWGSHNQDYPNLGFFLCDSIPVANLPAGATYDLWGTRRVLYSALPAGPCAVVCFVDRTDLVNETNEADNYCICRGNEIAP